MTIYYNPAYSATPYRKSTDNAEFGNIYCGDLQLLQRFLFYAGVPYRPVANEERIAHYHANIQQKITNDSPFYESFKTDSAGMSRSVLGWRDALVEVGWDVKSYSGNSIKLTLLRDIEPEDMPRGEADYWYQLIETASQKRILPEDFDVVVTCLKEHIKPHIAHILDIQVTKGVKVEYRPIETSVAQGNLGKIQKAILSGSKDNISLDKDDDTFKYIKFPTDDDALRYVATEPIDATAVYYCSKPKRFDNTLRLLGKPAVGSYLTSASPQIVQLFILGNGLFEYPLHIHRIIEWLNMPISPIDWGLRHELSNVLINSGGVNNTEWNDAIKKYLNNENEQERKKIEKQLKTFLPIPQSDIIDVESVKSFNNNLRKWAVQQLAIKDSYYSDIVREQIVAIESYCSTLIKMLENAPVGLTFLDLQLWCKNIAQPSTYGQYDAEVCSHTTIATMGDLHDIADSVVWFPAEDCGTTVYPFDMLNNEEYAEIERVGGMLYKRELHTLINQTAMLRILLSTKRLTIIEAEKSNGEKVIRHPLVLQLYERINGGLKSITETVEISEDYIAKDYNVNNENKNPTLLQLEDGIELKERHEREDDEVKQAESYSSLSQLIHHPFTYVCEKCAKIKDNMLPSAEDLNKTLGNVAHLIIERVFTDRSIEEAIKYYQAEYKNIFNEAVNEKGLLLLLPENGIELRRLRIKMKEALDKLAGIITTNDLSVDGCEFEFESAHWKEAGEEVKLESRADMLLSDKNGGKVIFDFKYSDSKSRKTEVEENRALQLEVYRYLAKQNFGERVPVRVAYVLLPDVNIITADSFENVETINVKADRKDVNIMLEAADSYRFRWEQLKSGKIERVEGEPVGTGEYAEHTTERVPGTERSV